MKSEPVIRPTALGWQALVDRLGYADATRFVMLLDKGSGDSVRYFGDLWKDKSAEDIYQEMLTARQTLHAVGQVGGR